MTGNVYKKYGDIIHLPHPVSKKHPPMPMLSRAAQFAPFAALTGYEDALENTALQKEREVEAENGYGKPAWDE